MSKNIFLLILFYFTISCNENNNSERNLRLVRDNVSFNVNYAASAMYFDNNRDEYFGFTEHRTGSKITVFRNSDTIYYEYSLRPIKKELKAEISDITFASPDTLVILSQGKNIVSYVNKRGEIVKNKDYSYLLLEGHQMYDFICFHNGCLSTGVGYGGQESDNQSTLQGIIDVNHKVHYGPLFLYDSQPFNDIKPQLQIDSFYNKFVKDDEYSGETNKFEMVNDLKIYYSGFSDTIYFYDLHGIEVKKIGIKSNKYTTKKIPTKIKDGLASPGLSVRNTKNSTFIFSVLYDKYRNLFYCVIRGKYDESRDSYPFNVLVYDSDFKLLSEKPFDSIKYYLEFFVGRDGLYIKQQHNNNFNKVVYSIFRYE